ncbi:MAG TPA: FtsW/RodA/SpoVE family cell cycle protein [Candidatus Limnocylindrales bacterium]|jgi:rod shape determining protein RodA
MGILRAEPFKIGSWASRSASVAWRNYDFQLTTYAVLLTCFGLAMAYSNSVGPTHTTLSPTSPFVRSLLWAVLAAITYAIATAFDYKWLRTFTWPLYLVNVVLLGLTLRFGSGVGEAAGSARWFSILGFPFQFSELAKILMILVFAGYLASRQKNMKSVWTIIGAAIVLAPPWVLIMLQPDLGTSLVIVATLVGMLFMAEASLFWLGTMAGAVVAAIPIVWTHLQIYQQARLLALLNPEANPQGAGYQLVQAKLAVTAGGIWGKGLTNGTVDLPVKQSDFVWGVLAEELGFVGAMVVLLLFAALLWRILVSAWRSSDHFAMLVASGLASMILFQVSVNVGMVIGLVPITGIPLPFVTYGGASLVSLALGLGILQGTNMRREKPEW